MFFIYSITLAVPVSNSLDILPSESGYFHRDIHLMENLANCLSNHSEQEIPHFHAEISNSWMASFLEATKQGSLSD
jgi:hypothetical protein